MDNVLTPLDMDKRITFRILWDGGKSLEKPRNRSTKIILQIFMGIVIQILVPKNHLENHTSVNSAVTGYHMVILNHIEDVQSPFCHHGDFGIVL